jgi:hypothetical protein
MERAEISAHQVRVFRFVSDAKRWVSNDEIAAGAQVAPRTARAHTRHFVSLGIFDQAEIFPSHRYQLSSKAEKRNKAYLLRLRQAEAVLFS